MRFHVAFSLISAALLAFWVGPLLAVLLADPAGAFVHAWGDRQLLLAVGTSMACAAAATVIGLILAVPLGWVLERTKFRGKSLVQATLALPLLIPHPVVGIALLLLLAPRGLLGSLLTGTFGVEIVSAGPGIVLAMLFVSSPLIVRAAQEGFRSVDPKLEQVAQSLGATPGQSFRTVALPLARPAIVSGTAAAFARALSEFGSIAVLAYFPRTAPVLIWDRFTTYGLSGALPATAFLLMVSLLLFWLAPLLFKGRIFVDRP